MTFIWLFYSLGIWDKKFGIVSVFVSKLKLFVVPSTQHSAFCYKKNLIRQTDNEPHHTKLLVVSKIKEVLTLADKSPGLSKIVQRS